MEHFSSAHISPIGLPVGFMPEDDYSSHRPLLYWALIGAKLRGKHFVELGCGYGSTNQVRSYCYGNNIGFASYETDPQWADRFNGVTLIEDYSLAAIRSDCLLFIDSKPGEDRAALTWMHKHFADVIIVHDTEPGAEYVYHMQNTLDGFKYRCDLVIHGMPQTTAVSMTYDLTWWKGLRFKEVNGRII